MPEMQVAREALSHLLVDIQDIEESVVRGEKRLGGQTYAVAYVDFADQVVARSENLREFQERVLGDDFFDASGDLRWNKYLYIVAGPNSIADASAFAVAKATIEADKDYARKRVVSEHELESLLGGPRLFEPTAASQTSNVLADWEQRLSAQELDLLLDCPTPRTAAVERIAQGTAKRASIQGRTKPINAADTHLATSKLTELTIENFRQVHNGKTYRFGQVTLLIGPNGSGKTSLLEAVEFLYCGHNRRDNSASSLRVKGKLEKLGTGEEYPLASTIEAARIKARCLAWYNRDERNAKSILDGFTRYNFLDTDAAFRISTDLEPSEIATDLSRLLVGSSAAVTWDYLTKIHADVERAWDKSQGNADRQKLVLEANEKALKEMQDKPSAAKALAESYRQTLGTLGWLQVPTNSKLTSSEGELLLSVLGHVQALQAAGSGARTISALRVRHAELEEAVSLAAPYASELTEFHPKQKTLTDAIKIREATIGNIDRWLAYVSSGFPRIRALAPKTTREAQEATGRLGKFVVGQLPEIPPAYQAVPLEMAIRATGDALNLAEARVEELRKFADSHGRAAAARASSAHRLKEAVSSLLAQTSDLNICPVCKTAHPPGELSRLIAAITDETAESPELQQVTEALGAAQTQLRIARNHLDIIKFIEGIARALSLSTDSSATDVLGQLIELRTQSVALAEIARATSNELRELSEGGFSPNEYDLLWSQLAPVFTNEATTEAANAARRQLREDIDRKQHELAEVQSKLMAAGFAIRDIYQRVATPQWNTSVKDTETVAALRSLREEFSFVLARIPEIQALLTIGDDTSFAEIKAKAANAFAAFKEAFSAAEIEASNFEGVIELAQTVANGKLVLVKTQKEAKFLRKAVDVLRNLFDESSLEKASQESLAAIGAQINEVFSRIHAPREYEYVGEQEILLRTTATQEARTLEQVSTGQRAAFALSIFLALNRTAKSAPPILLIDDPIAHIDDLNALSFLDYLRDLAVNSGRQILFATADTRIASLFSKKFSFLGDGFKSIQLTRASAA